MRLRSPAWRSELALNASEIEIEDYASYMVVRSPRWPTHIWKNFLLFEANQGPLTPADWLAVYASHFPHGGAYSAIAVGWDTDYNNPLFDSAMREVGFATDREIVLRARKVHRSLAREKISVEPVADNSVWAEVVQRRISLLAVGRKPDLQAQFEREKFEIYRSLVREGKGAWFVARRGFVPVGDMGVFVTPERVGRFQEVLVYPGFRGEGNGRAMVGQASKQIRDRHDVTYFVTVTQPGSIAERAYRSIGFEHCGVQARAVKIAM